MKNCDHTFAAKVFGPVTVLIFWFFDLSIFKLTRRDDGFIVVVQASGDARAPRHEVDFYLSSGARVMGKKVPQQCAAHKKIKNFLALQTVEAKKLVDLTGFFSTVHPSPSETHPEVHSDLSMAKVFVRPGSGSERKATFPSSP